MAKRHCTFSSAWLEAEAQRHLFSGPLIVFILGAVASDQCVVLDNDIAEPLTTSH
jgi:hypothetical protein